MNKIKAVAVKAKKELDISKKEVGLRMTFLNHKYLLSLI